ncbi:MAG: hypothetical protein K1X79_04660 [Oligoflexia bacterium]|nr:hypothetical protein [Oligoflexia bacterium]
MMMDARLILRIMLCAALASGGLTGCFLAPAIDSFNKLGVTAGDREKLLAERIRVFNDAVSFGQPGDAEAFFVPEQRAGLEKEFRKQRKQEKVVDSRIESVGFSNESRTALVEVTVRYYKVPYYVVNERLEIQEWKFIGTSGWFLSSRKEGVADSVA